MRHMRREHDNGAGRNIKLVLAAPKAVCAAHDAKTFGLARMRVQGRPFPGSGKVSHTPYAPFVS
jgi:hypothetical protein